MRSLTRRTAAGLAIIVPALLAACEPSPPQPPTTTTTTTTTVTVPSHDIAELAIAGEYLPTNLGARYDFTVRNSGHFAPAAVVVRVPDHPTGLAAGPSPDWTCTGGGADPFVCTYGLPLPGPLSTTPLVFTDQGAACSGNLTATVDPWPGENLADNSVTPWCTLWSSNPPTTTPTTTPPTSSPITTIPTTTTSVPPNSGGLVVDLGVTITQGEPGTSGRVIHVTNHGPNPVGPGIAVTVFPNSGTVVATPGWPCVQVDPDVHVADDEYYVCTSTVALAPGQTADLPAVFMFFYGSAQVEPWAGEINLSTNSAACTPECS